MTDRESIMFLTRASEALVQRGRDIRYMQEHQDKEHCQMLQDLLGVLDRMRHAIIGEIREFSQQEVGQLQHPGQAATGKSLEDQRAALTSVDIEKLRTVARRSEGFKRPEDHV
jgi:hypothetical protein